MTWPGRGRLAAEAVGVAERVGARRAAVRGVGAGGPLRPAGRRPGDGGRGVRAGRSVAAEHGLLKQQVEAEFGRGLLAQVEAGWRPEMLARPRELALEAGMLADVARIDLIVADGVLAAEGPAAAEPLAEACVALHRRAAAQRPAGGDADDPGRRSGRRRGPGRCAAAGGVRARPARRAPDVPAHASMVRAFPPLLAGDLARADELMRPGMQSLLAYPAAPPLSYLGLWALLCAVRGDDEPARGAGPPRRGSTTGEPGRAGLRARRGRGPVRRGGAGGDALRRRGRHRRGHAVVDPAPADARPARGAGRRLGRAGRRRRRAAGRPRRARAPRRPPARPHLPGPAPPGRGADAPGPRRHAGARPRCGRPV